MLAFKPPLALRPWCPPLHPPSFSHTNTVFTQTFSITHTGRYSLIYISGKKHAAFARLLRSAVDEMRENVHLCLFFFYVCVNDGKGGDGIRD